MAEIETEMVHVKSDSAICILNAFKTFSSDTCVLDGLSMNVPLGSIYGLLGPSGCGKTTLINIILGKLSLDSGLITLNTNNLSDIGHMPQDLGLDTTLSVSETFEYYGSLYKLSKNRIASKVDELNTWLKLPSGDQLLKDLSGGQCRRVSLAVTLLHDPKIIILDEPTVGIDPILRHEIWKQLLSIVREQNKTIILTTHYIEEAHQAQVIGLMRNGVLIEEASPQVLLAKQNTNSLEAAFLSLSRSQTYNNIARRNKVVRNKKVTSEIMHSDNGISITRILAFIKKNIAICSRDFSFIFFMILFPMMASIVFNIAIGGNIKDVNIAIQNEETSDCKTIPAKNDCLFENNYNNTLSCEVLNGLRSLEYNIIEVDNQEAGEILVDKVDSVAFVQFPQNFSKGLRLYAIGSWFSPNEYSTKSLAYANIDVGNMLIKNQVIRNLVTVLENVLINSTRNCNESLNYRQGFKITHLVGDKVETFIHSIATMFVSMIGFYFSSVISTGFMLTEKMEGFLDRSMTAGITILEVVISVMCMQTVIHIFQTISLIFFTYIVFKNPIEITNGLFAFVLIIFLNGWLGLLCGLLIVGISKASNDAMHMVIGWNMMQIYLSGVMWPIEAQTPIMKLISENLPLCYISRLLNNIVLKGWTLGHPKVLIGIAIIVGYVLIHVALLLYLTRVKKDAWLVKK